MGGTEKVTDAIGMTDAAREEWAARRGEAEPSLLPDHLWRDERDRRFAERAELQRQLHEADPEHNPLLVPVDDPEFGTEAYTPGWGEEQQDEDDTDWDGDSEDAADSTADDLDLPCRVCGWEPEHGNHDDDDHEFEPVCWNPTGEFAIYTDGDYRPVMPDELPEAADQPIWNLGAVESDGGSGEASYRYDDIVSGVTLVEAARVAEERDISLEALGGTGPWVDAIRAEIRRDVSRPAEV
jgi:hypothetical protein